MNLASLDCRRFVVALGELGPTAELARHAANCPRCGRLWDLEQALRHSGPAPTLPPMAAELQRQLFEHRPTTRTTTFATRTLSVLAAIAASVGFVVLAVPRQDLSVATFASVTSCVLLGLSLLGLGLFAYRGTTGLGVAPWLRWSAALTMLAAFSLSAALEASSPSMAEERDCLLLGSAIAGLVAAIGFKVSLRTALIAPAASGALVGAVAGLAALWCLRAHCASLFAPHVLIVHGLPLALAIGGGAFAGRRWLRV